MHFDHGLGELRCVSLEFNEFIFKLSSSPFWNPEDFRCWIGDLLVVNPLEMTLSLPKHSVSSADSPMNPFWLTAYMGYIRKYLSDF